MYDDLRRSKPQKSFQLDPPAEDTVSYQFQITSGPGAARLIKIAPFYPDSYLCGDADGSSSVTISDSVYLINYIFAGGPAPNPLLAGDADCSGIVTISDTVYLINYIFAGGPAPCASCP
ncbi:MAG: dockerin type I domain-containing protein [Candidatus Zixiibacteriota bacterium]